MRFFRSVMANTGMAWTINGLLACLLIGLGGYLFARMAGATIETALVWARVWGWFGPVFVFGVALVQIGRGRW